MTGSDVQSTCHVCVRWEYMLSDDDEASVLPCDRGVLTEPSGSTPTQTLRPGIFTPTLSSTTLVYDRQTVTLAATTSQWTLIVTSFPLCSKNSVTLRLDTSLSSNVNGWV